MPGEGIEPSWGCPRWILNPVRLPISPPRLEFLVISGGAKGDRTPDLLHAMQALSQTELWPPKNLRADKVRSIYQSRLSLSMGMDCKPYIEVWLTIN